MDVEERVLYALILLALSTFFITRFAVGARSMTAKEILLVVAILAIPLAAIGLVIAPRPTAEVFSAMAAAFALALGVLLRRDFLAINERLTHATVLLALAVAIPLAAVLAYRFAPVWDRPEAPSTFVFLVMGMLSRRSRLLFWTLWLYVCGVVFFFIDQRSTLLLLFAIPLVELALVLRRRSRFLARAAVVALPVVIVAAIFALATLEVGRFALIQEGLDGSSLGRFEEIEVLRSQLTARPIALMTGLGAGYALTGNGWTRDFLHIGFADLVYTHGVMLGVSLGALVTVGFAKTLFDRDANPIIVYALLGALMNFLLYNHRAYFIDVFIVGCMVGLGMDRLLAARRAKEHGHSDGGA